MLINVLMLRFLSKTILDRIELRRVLFLEVVWALNLGGSPRLDQIKHFLSEQARCEFVCVCVLERVDEKFPRKIPQINTLTNVPFTHVMSPRWVAAPTSKSIIRRKSVCCPVVGKTFERSDKWWQGLTKVYVFLILLSLLIMRRSKPLFAILLAVYTSIWTCTLRALS